MAAFGKGVRCDFCGKFTKDRLGHYEVNGKVYMIRARAYYGQDEREDALDMCEHCWREGKRFPL